MAIDERLVKGFGLWTVIKALLDDVLLNLLEVLDILVVCELVHVHSVGFVAPETDDVQRARDAIVGSKDLDQNGCCDMV